MEGHVYILSNEHVPNLLKIGFTDRDPEIRARELSNNTGVPGYWVVQQHWLVEDAYNLEQRIFKDLSPQRVTGEFFKLELNDAINRVSKLLHTYGAINDDGLSPAELKKLEKKRRAQEKKEQQRLELEKAQSQFDNEWNLYFNKEIKPWCDLMQKCVEVRADYRAPNFIERMFGSNKELAHYRSWPGFDFLLRQLIPMLETSRNVRAYRRYFSEKYAYLDVSGKYIGKVVNPTGVNMYYPGGDGHHLFFLNEKKPLDYYREEIECVIRCVFGYCNQDLLNAIMHTTYWDSFARAIKSKMPPEISLDPYYD